MVVCPRLLHVRPDRFPRSLRPEFLADLGEAGEPAPPPVAPRHGDSSVLRGGGGRLVLPSAAGRYISLAAPPTGQVSCPGYSGSAEETACAHQDGPTY